METKSCINSQVLHTHTHQTVGQLQITKLKKIGLKNKANNKENI